MRRQRMLIQPELLVEEAEKGLTRNVVRLADLAAIEPRTFLRERNLDAIRKGQDCRHRFADLSRLLVDTARILREQPARLVVQPGGLAEDVVRGANVGETFRTIIADQFRPLRDGDRFWNESDRCLLANPELLEIVQRGQVLRAATRSVSASFGVGQLMTLVELATDDDAGVEFDGEIEASIVEATGFEVEAATLEALAAR